MSAAAGKRRRVVITAGPTHEHLDPVRYLGNESSGKMGFELARAAQQSAEGERRKTIMDGDIDSARGQVG